MNTSFNNQLVELHHKVAALKVYDDPSGKKLQQYANAYSKVLKALVSTAPEKFEDIERSYRNDTAKDCKAAANKAKEDDRSAAFYDGVGKLNTNINDSLEYFSASVGS